MIVHYGVSVLTDAYIDRKYISLLSPYLKQFRQRGENIWNFRCPLCGDSKKDTVKARGFIYRKKQEYKFYCHNCFRSYRISEFIKIISPPLYGDYLLEAFGKKDEPKAEEFVCEPVFHHPKTMKDVETINDLSDKHPARVYITERKIPKDKWGSIYYVDNFKEFVDKMVPEHGKTIYQEPRIVLPFYNDKNELLGFQGRAIGVSKVKYITIKLDESNPKVYGWDKVDPSKTIYVLEGPIDSLFFENAVASMDADLTRVVPVIGLDCDYVFVYDAEPRNKQIVSNMRKTIERGHRVCVWPNTFTFKDVNEAVIGGESPSFIQHTVDQNAYSELEAVMKLNEWSRI